MTCDIPPPRPAPFQFSLRAMFGIVTAMAVLMSLLQWVRVPWQVSVLVLAILALGSVAAVGLLLVIAKAAEKESESSRPPASQRDKEEQDGSQ